METLRSLVTEEPVSSFERARKENASLAPAPPADIYLVAETGEKVQHSPQRSQQHKENTLGRSKWWDDLVWRERVVKNDPAIGTIGAVPDDPAEKQTLPSANATCFEFY
jgi:hypothetical protein